MVLARYLCSLQVLKFDEYFIKIVPNDPKSWSQIVELIRNGIPKRFFEFGARILRIGHFSGWKSKFFEVSSWHFKHPIKLNFLIWHLERPYPDKKSILEKRQFKSCPFDASFWTWKNGYLHFPILLRPQLAFISSFDYVLVCAWYVWSCRTS